MIVILIIGTKIYFEANNFLNNNEFQKMINIPQSTIEIRELEEHKTLELDGYSVHYYLSGKENSETIIFLHPAFSDHRAFDRQIELFSKKYKIITVDLIGHGLSKANKSKDRIDESANHLDKILELEKVNQAHIVGVSVGSLIAQYFALEYPDKTLSLSSLGGYCIDKENKEVEKAQRASNMGLIIKAIFSLESFRKQTAKISTHTEEGRVLFYNSASLFERKSFMAMQGLQNVVKDRERKKAEYPILILTGEFDIELAKKMAEEWHNELENSEYKIIKGAGHCANMDRPEDFNETLVNFLNKITKPNKDV